MSQPLFSKLSIAPMIDWTYTHFRVFMRYLAPNALLYTEMQTSGAVLNNPQRALYYDPVEHPIAIQLGGSDPKTLALSAQMAEQSGYDEINLNLGCPSDKVQAGHFGACLMNEPEIVVACIKAIKQVVSIPVTTKTRIGIDSQDSFEFFSNFSHKLVEAGSDTLIIHARKAWLHGLSPRQNRTIPPINYSFVYQLKEQLPHVPIVINGNISNAEEVLRHLSCVDGVMLGRLACDNPYEIARIHHVLYPEVPLPTRSELWLSYKNYLVDAYNKEVPLSLLCKPLFNLMHGISGSKQWKHQLMACIQSKNIRSLNALDDYILELDPIFE